jgi:hypothetical protein
MFELTCLLDIQFGRLQRLILYVIFLPCDPLCPPQMSHMSLFVLLEYNLFISFAVDLIHLILYFNLVMSFWCLRDLPVSGQMTAFAISGKLIMSVFVLDW